MRLYVIDVNDTYWLIFVRKNSFRVKIRMLYVHFWRTDRNLDGANKEQTDFHLLSLLKIFNFGSFFSTNSAISYKTPHSLNSFVQ